jgi:hypothetical protein
VLAATATLPAVLALALCAVVAGPVVVGPPLVVVDGACAALATEAASSVLLVEALAAALGIAVVPAVAVVLAAIAPAPAATVAAASAASD